MVKSCTIHVVSSDGFPIEVYLDLPEENPADALVLELAKFRKRGFISPTLASQRTKQMAVIGVIRAEAKNGNPAVWFYGSWQEKRLMRVYLDTPGSIADFEAASGLTVADMPLCESEQPPSRGSKDYGKYVRDASFSALARFEPPTKEGDNGSWELVGYVSAPVRSPKAAPEAKSPPPPAPVRPPQPEVKPPPGPGDGVLLTERHMLDILFRLQMTLEDFYAWMGDSLPAGKNTGDPARNFVSAEQFNEVVFGRLVQTNRPILCSEVRVVVEPPFAEGKSPQRRIYVNVGVGMVKEFSRKVFRDGRIIGAEDWAEEGIINPPPFWVVLSETKSAKKTSVCIGNAYPAKELARP